MRLLIIITLLLKTLTFAKDDNIEKLGDVIQVLIPTTGWLTSIYIDDDEGTDQFYKSFFSTLGTTYTLKYTVNEERPDGSSNTSFPSGHTSASFQGASFIHFRYGFKYAIPAYLGATFVGYSRVYAKKHYTHDVVAGAIIGTSFSYYFTTPYKVGEVSVEPVAFNTNDIKTNLYGVKFTW